MYLWYTHLAGSSLASLAIKGGKLVRLRGDWSIWKGCMIWEARGLLESYDSSVNDLYQAFQSFVGIQPFGCLTSDLFWLEKNTLYSSYHLWILGFSSQAWFPEAARCSFQVYNGPANQRFWVSAWITLKNSTVELFLVSLCTFIERLIDVTDISNNKSL